MITKTIKITLVPGILLIGVMLVLMNFYTNFIHPSLGAYQTKTSSNSISTKHVDRIITVISSNTQGYAPDTIHIKYGETVKLVLMTADDAHSFTMPGYNINQMIYPGKQTELVFHATKKGTFSFFCVVPCPMIKNSGTIIIS